MRTNTQEDKRMGVRGGSCEGWGGVVLDGTIINDCFQQEYQTEAPIISESRRIFAGKNKMAGNSPTYSKNVPAHCLNLLSLYLTKE